MSPTQYTNLMDEMQGIRGDLKALNDVLLPAVVKVIEDKINKKPCIQATRLKKLETENADLKKELENIKKMIEK